MLISLLDHYNFQEGRHLLGAHGYDPDRDAEIEHKQFKWGEESISFALIRMWILRLSSSKVCDEWF